MQRSHQHELFHFPLTCSGWGTLVKLFLLSHSPDHCLWHLQNRTSYWIIQHDWIAQLLYLRACSLHLEPSILTLLLTNSQTREQQQVGYWRSLWPVAMFMHEWSVSVGAILNSVWPLWWSRFLLRYTNKICLSLLLNGSLYLLCCKIRLLLHTRFWNNEDLIAFSY